MTPPVSNHVYSASLRGTKWIAVGTVDVGLLYTSIGMKKHNCRLLVRVMTVVYFTLVSQTF